MRVFSSPTAAYFASRGPFVGHVLIWFTARNRDNGDAETIGFWTGADHRDFVIDQSTRRYYAAGALLRCDPIRRQTGIKVSKQRVVFSQVAPEVQLAVRGYDIRHAPVELHRALFAPLSDNLIDEPHEILRGYVDKV